MIHTVGNISDLHTKINTYFSTFKTEILRLTRLGWNEEDLRGKSYYQWKVMQYYNLLYYFILIYEEQKQLTNTQGWSYYIDKYDLRNLKDCVACEGIDFKKALDAFNFGDINGIEEMEVEQSFQVQGSEYEIASMTIKDRLAEPIKCVSYIEELEPGINVGDDENFDAIQDTITDNEAQVIDSE